MNGKLLNTLTILPNTLFKRGLGIIPLCSIFPVIHKRIPKGNPRIREKRVADPTIMRVCNVALRTRVII
jgi:hypothetical protein